MSSHSLAKTSALREQVLHECIAMTRYALASGMAVPPALVNTIEAARFAPADKPMDMAPIVKAHDQLAKLVAPATPRALLVMGDEHTQGTRLAWVGSVGLVRRMMGVAVACVVIFVALSLTGATNLSKGPVTIDTNQGWDLLWNELFWMAAAGIGASFALLRQVNDFIVSRTYDPKYEPTYWIKFLLGVMAGYIMATLVPAAIGVRDVSAGTAALGVPMLALLGGFSASAVYRILTKLVESVENVFRDSPRDEAAQREKAAQAKAGEELSATRMNVAGQLVRLQQQLATGADTAALSQALGGILHTLVPAAAADGATPDTAPSNAGTISLPHTRIVAAPGTPTASADPGTSAANDASGEASDSSANPSGEASDDASSEAADPAPSAAVDASGEADKPAAASTADAAGDGEAKAGDQG